MTRTDPAADPTVDRLDRIADRLDGIGGRLDAAVAAAAAADSPATIDGIRVPRGAAIPVPVAAIPALISASPCVLLGWCLSVVAGSAIPSFLDGIDATGDVVLPNDTAQGFLAVQWFGDGGIFFRRGLYLYGGAGTTLYRGAVFLRPIAGIRP